MRKLFVAMIVVAAWCGVASAKPKIAILGLEVIVPDNKADPDSVRVATEVTAELRVRAKLGTGPYSMAPGSERELLDEKLANNCEAEVPACMAAIGQAIGADLLMYGKLERKPAGYQISVKLLDVNRRILVRSSSDLISVADATQASRPWARRLYNRITGAASTLRVLARDIDRGTVFLDGAEQGTLVGGKLEIQDLAEGRYRLAIEAEGYARWEQDITQRAGESTAIEADLQKAAVAPGPAAAARSPRGCGCDASSPPPAGTFVLGLAMLGLWWRRPRRA